jgi:hypothetical protein
VHNSDFIRQTAREPHRRNSLDPRNDSVDATLANEIVRFGSVHCTQSVGVEDRHKANMSRRVFDLAVCVEHRQANWEWASLGRLPTCIRRGILA